MQFKKKKKENETKGGKKGGNCKGPVIIYRLKGAEVRRILGITQFSGERRGELPMNSGGGGRSSEYYRASWGDGGIS